MVSAAEQLAANLNFSALAKADELKKRIWFTLGALLVYRLGTYIPLPGIDPSAWDQIFRSQAGGILGMFNMFSGGGIQRMAIFALNIMPYISASIIIQLMTTVSPTLEQLKKEGEQGRKVMNQYTRYLTVVLAAFQSYGIAIGLEGAGNVISDPGWFFRISTVITLDRRNHVPDVARRAGYVTWDRQRHFADHSRGNRRGAAVRDRRHTRARPPGRAVDRIDPGGTGDVGGGHRLHRIHGAGATQAPDPISQAPGRQSHVRGPVLASAAQAQHFGRDPADLRLLAAAASYDGRQLQCRAAAGLGRVIVPQLSHGRPLFLFLYMALIVFFAFFYTAIVFNPTETADNLKKHGGFIPGIRPGERTAEYIDYVLSRITVIGAAYLALVCLLPEMLISYAAVPFYFGGTSLLIVVSVTMDTVAQIQGYLLAHQYEGLIKRSKLRGRRR